MPGLMSVSEDDSDNMDDETTSPVPPSAAQYMYTFVYDFLASERARLRLSQEAEIRSMNLFHTDPEVLTATMWGAYLTISDVLHQSLNGNDEEAFAATSQTIIPFFDLLSERISTHGMNQRVQVVRAGDCIDPDSDILVLKTSTFRRRLQHLKAKYQSITVNRAEGFKPPDLYRRDDVQMAHAAQSIITLHMGGAAYIQAPFPPHLLRDTFAVRRYEQQCVPGTVYFENMPSFIREVRLLYLLCVICGGSHPWNALECRRRHLEERLVVSAGYSEVQCGPCVLYYPQYLKDDIKYHSQHYVQVYPGSVFLFDRVPLAVIAARKHFRVCETCGILHMTTLASPLQLHCPYDLVLLANRFVRISHQYEIAHCAPAMTDTQAVVNA
jgi:hypothetical protein